MNAPRVFPFVAVCFGVAAAFHAFAVFTPVDPSSPRWRHAAFVAINLAVAIGMLRRPPWFVWVFGALVAQQLWSHGRAFVASTRSGRLDVSSVLVLIGLPIVFALLVAGRDRRSRHDRAQP